MLVGGVKPAAAKKLYAGGAEPCTRPWVLHGLQPCDDFRLDSYLWTVTSMSMVSELFTLSLQCGTEMNNLGWIKTSALHKFLCLGPRRTFVVFPVVEEWHVDT